MRNLVAGISFEISNLICYIFEKEERPRIVLTPLENFHTHFNPYYRHNSLTIQFIISEFIEIHQLFNQINLIIETHNYSSHLLSEHFPQLFDLFKSLLGCQSDSKILHLWTQGSLTKLKNYCDCLSQNSHHQNANILKLKMQVHQMWLDGCYSFEMLKQIQESLPLAPEQASFMNFTKKYTRLHALIKKSAKCLSRVLTLYQQDENVLFFLLRKKEPLATIYGPSFISKIFKTVFKGENQAFQWLKQKYMMRGFHHMTPLLHQQFNQIDVLYEPC